MDKINRMCGMKSKRKNIDGSMNGALICSTSLYLKLGITKSANTVSTIIPHVLRVVAVN